MNDKLTKYRDYLVQTEQKVSESYDKTIITLSGGALGVSFAFLKDVIGTNPVQSKGVLVVAWTSLTVSLVSVVLSLLFGTMAFRKAIKQVDEKKISDVVAGGMVRAGNGNSSYLGCFVPCTWFDVFGYFSL